MRLAGSVDLAHSLHGGQAFRWTREGDAFHGVIAGKPVELRALPGGAVDATGATRRELERYFRLEAADAARRTRLLADPILAPAMLALPGLRLLRQEPWETTVAFLTSANNNVLRIEGTMRALAARWGEPVDVPVASHRYARARADGTPPVRETLRAFPAPDVLARASEAELRACGLGYRAPFLRESARMVAAGEVDLAALRGRAATEVREAMLALPGVGPKVADCIALFSLDVDAAFPIDRWVLRAVAEATAQGRRRGKGRRKGEDDDDVTPKEAAAWAAARWGADAGLAQQYLFHAIRMKERAPGTARVA